MNNRKTQLLLAAIVVVLFCFVYNYTFDSKIDLNGDNFTYVQLARNMSQGLGYSNVSASGIAPASHFPPGYSAFLSLFMHLGIDNMRFFELLNGFCLVVALLCLGFLVERITRQQYLAFAVIVLAMLSPQLLHFAGMAMSEMSYMLCAVLCFLFLYKYSSNKSSVFWKSPWFYLAIVAAVATYYIRTVGASVIAAMIIFYLFRKEWLAAGASAAGVVLLQLPWMLRNVAAGIEGRYFGTIMTVNPWRPEQGSISSFSEMISKMLTNIDETVIKGFKEILFPFMDINYEEPSGLFAIIGGLLIVGIILFGAWHMGKLNWAMITFILANIGLFALWHGGNGSRYVVPIAPFIYVTFYVGLFMLLLKNRVKENSYFALIFLIMAFPMISPLQTQAEIASQPMHPAYKNYFTIAEEVNKKAPKGSVVCCRKPEIFAYYAPNTFTVNYKYDTNPDSVLADLVRKKVDFVILEQLGYSSTPLYLLPAIQANPDLFPILWYLQAPDTYLLKFNREAATQKIANHATIVSP